ncbi:MAG: DUF2946 family protein [Sphingomonas phyllosphaerae]|uniref:DUF2946 family protein n=1 Tax=Sphingomonas phyllosphaerae TaxID=257003 RepID=UPI002FFD3567
MSGIRTRSTLFAIVAALALLVRLLVPAGFMPQVAHGQVAIVACPGMAMATSAHHHAQDAPVHDGFERPCAFAAVAAPATLLAIVLLLVLPPAAMVQQIRRLAPPLAPRLALRWRPPLRAPPTILPTR